MGFVKRRRTSAAHRAQLAYNQEYKCAECGKMLPVAWEVDHIIPLMSFHWEATYPNRPRMATEAANAFENLQGLCNDCHGRKSLYETCGVDDGNKSAKTSTVSPKAGNRRAPLPWALQRSRARSSIDAIWAHAAKNDPLTSFIMSPEIWLGVNRVSTQDELRRIHQKAKREGKLNIPFSVFELRVHHLCAA